MKRKIPLLIEIGIGVLLTALVAWSYGTRHPFLETASLKTYDLFSGLKKTSSKIDAIQIVEIDDQSLSNIGRWPWSRAIVGQLIDSAVEKGAKVIGLNILFVDQNQNENATEFGKLYKTYGDLMARHRPLFKKKGINPKPFESILDAMDEINNGFDEDGALALSIEQAANVVLPMYFIPGEALGNNLDPLPKYADTQKSTLKADALPKEPSGVSASLPLEPFGAMAIAIGHSNLTPDIDGTIRRTPPFVAYGNSLFPSFGLQLIRTFLNLPMSALVTKPNVGIALQKADIPLDETGYVYINYAAGTDKFKKYSAVDVLFGAIPDNAMKDKIVLIGITAPGQGEIYVTPGGERRTGLDLWAIHIENILSQRFIIRPPWAAKVEWLGIVLAGLVVMLVLPFLRGRFSIPIAGVLFAASLSVSFVLFLKKGAWVSPAYGSLLLVSGFVLLVAKRLLFTERGKERVEAEGMETNKMLGLSFQGQGMLDLAFEKFSKCPIDDSIKDLLYNL